MQYSRFWCAMLVPLLMVAPAMGAANSDEPQIETKSKGNVMNSHSGKTIQQGYESVNGLKMYYEIEGTGDPLVFIPPAFGFAGLESFPALTHNHSVITIDLQGNGRTADIPEHPISIEQYAKDVVGLLKYLGISKADFFGESYGGNTAALMAIRYPELVRRVVTYSAMFGLPKDALNPATTQFGHPPTADDSYIQFQRENYKKVAPDANYWSKIFDKVGGIQWGDFSTCTRPKGAFSEALGWSCASACEPKIKTAAESAAHVLIVAPIFIVPRCITKST